MTDPALVQDRLDAFLAVYGFTLDDFQLEAVASLAHERSVLVAAPTGAGKTVVGEFAVWHAIERGGKCFYTTPIKALSNQKYHDLVARHGADQVGLLTGDNVINGEAPVVVMTTEVLRNMLYEASGTLAGLHAVVLDEVHYLADRERGAVWEEVIVQLPLGVQLACLSATVSNAEEFGAWLRTVRETCDVVISEFRPVPLEHHYAVNDRVEPVFRSGSAKAGAGGGRSGRQATARQARGGVPNPELLMLERRAGTRNTVSRRGRRQASDVRLRVPRRGELIRDLRRRKWLPAIWFVFSRNGCDAAVRQLVGDGLRLTSADERREIRRVVRSRTTDLPPEDLEVLGYSEWLTGLEAGIASHHAGMVPVFKETVEQLFTDNLVKVCFATETLALGINMPARTVVIERLEKWSGQRHELLTPGQFTQLTGRAGRRGMDSVGHAVVLHQRDIDFATVASLVGRRVEPLRSSFAPSYNMAVNLLRRHTRTEAEALLSSSFAQFQADATVVDDERRIAGNREALAGYADNLQSERGDFGEYWALRRELSTLEREGAKSRRRRRQEAVERGLAELREGDVVRLGDSEYAELAAVVSRTVTSKGVPLVGVVTEARRLERVGPRELDVPPQRVGEIRLPASGGPRKSAYRKQIALELRQLTPRAPADQDQRTGPDPDHTARIAQLRQEVHHHPVHDDPALADIEIWAHRHDELAAKTERLEQGVRRRTGSLVRQFDRIVRVLADLGYLEGEGDHPVPTDRGLLLAGLYAETDLVLAESIRTGVLDDLDTPDLAAVASVFVHETRAKEPPAVVLPTGAVADAFERATEVWRQVAGREEAAGLTPTRPLDASFADTVWRWAHGADLDESIGNRELTAGDFVRNTKQVADVLRQIRDSAEIPLRDTARRAAKDLVRGVVAYTGL